jgi:thiamine biosynthesis lipoprotein
MKYILILSIFLLFACKPTSKQYTAEIQFETMGTFGIVKLVRDSLEINQDELSKGIDSLLLQVNMNFSTYIDSSLISRFNAVDSGTIEINVAFADLIYAAEDYMIRTNFAFNPKILPLVRYYGFGDKIGTGSIDSLYVDSLLEIMGTYINKDMQLNEEIGEVFKYRPFQLDFSAFAKGYGVDVIAQYLENYGIQNYMVEIGGEVHCKGKNADGNIWRLGIEEPNEETRSIYEVVALNNKSMATSGNYRNFKILENGQRVVHIINPKTGYPEISNLLSASIVADDCMSADAYATACMVMGLDTCFQFLISHQELEGYLIYSDENGTLQTKLTDGFVKMIVE